MIFQKINFIKDPSLKYISGLNVLYQKNEFFGKSSEMLFWDDPDGIFNARPYVQNLIEIKRFVENNRDCFCMYVFRVISFLSVCKFVPIQIIILNNFYVGLNVNFTVKLKSICVVHIYNYETF